MGLGCKWKELLKKSQKIMLLSPTESMMFARLWILHYLPWHLVNRLTRNHHVHLTNCCLLISDCICCSVLPSKAHSAQRFKGKPNLCFLSSFYVVNQYTRKGELKRPSLAPGLIAPVVARSAYPHIVCLWVESECPSLCILPPASWCLLTKSYTWECDETYMYIV